MKPLVSWQRRCHGARHSAGCGRWLTVASGTAARPASRRAAVIVCVGIVSVAVAYTVWGDRGRDPLSWAPCLLILGLAGVGSSLSVSGSGSGERLERATLWAAALLP